MAACEHAPATLLQLVILGALLKGYAITRCRVDPALCSTVFHDYSVMVFVQLANATAMDSTNATHVEQRAVLSSLDAMSSCDTIILVLCLQMCPGIPSDACCACMLACVAAFSVQCYLLRHQMWSKSRSSFRTCTAKPLAARMDVQGSLENEPVQGLTRGCASPSIGSWVPAQGT